MVKADEKNEAGTTVVTDRVTGTIPRATEAVHARGDASRACEDGAGIDVIIDHVVGTVTGDSD